MKVISFSQQGPRAICILSASGVISNVTLRQPDSSGGTLTYEVMLILLSFKLQFFIFTSLMSVESTKLEQHSCRNYSNFVV